MEKVPDTGDQQEKASSANTSNNESFIFFDTHGKRWPRLKRIMFVAGGLLFVGIILFVPSQLTLPSSVEQLQPSTEGSPAVLTKRSRASA
jgi:hypothetical protein